MKSCLRVEENRCYLCRIGDPAEVVQQWYDAVNRRDIEAIVRWFHPDVRVYPAVVGPDGELPEELQGHDGVREWFDSQWAAWDAIRVEAKETIPTPDGYVLAVEAWHLRGREDIAIELEMFDLYEVREGLIVRLDGFRDRAEATAAAGL